MLARVFHSMSVAHMPTVHTKHRTLHSLLGRDLHPMHAIALQEEEVEAWQRPTVLSCRPLPSAPLQAACPCPLSGGLLGRPHLVVPCHHTLRAASYPAHGRHPSHHPQQQHLGSPLTEVCRPNTTTTTTTSSSSSSMTTRRWACTQQRVAAGAAEAGALEAEATAARLDTVAGVAGAPRRHVRDRTSSRAVAPDLAQVHVTTGTISAGTRGQTWSDSWACHPAGDLQSSDQR
jgi:hypothetical protein